MAQMGREDKRTREGRADGVFCPCGAFSASAWLPSVCGAFVGALGAFAPSVGWLAGSAHRVRLWWLPSVRLVHPLGASVSHRGRLQRCAQIGDAWRRAKNGERVTNRANCPINGTPTPMRARPALEPRYPPHPCEKKYLTKAWGCGIMAVARRRRGYSTSG